MTTRIPNLTGRRGGGSGASKRIARFPDMPILVSKAGRAMPPIRPTGGLGDLPRVVWGHAAVTGRLNVASTLDFFTQTILGAVQAAMKTGGRQSVIETIAGMAARSLTSIFEAELKRARIEAFQEGYRAGMAEGIARDRAARRAGEGATTIFPKAEHLLRKQDQAAGLELAKTLQAQHGTELANILDIEDIPPRPVQSISGWVQAAGLVEGHLAIQFRGSSKTGPVVCIYPGSGRAALEDLLSATSAGKWVHRHVYGAAYELGRFVIPQARVG